MSKIILSLVALVFTGFIIYMFFTGNIAIGIIMLVTGLVLIPVVNMFRNGGVHVTPAPDLKAYTDHNCNSDFDK